MKTTQIIYTTPQGVNLTYTTTHPVTIKDSLVVFFDEKIQKKRKFPIDRCQLVEVD